MKLHSFTLLEFNVIFKLANIAYINISTLCPLQPVQEILLLQGMQINELVVANFYVRQQICNSSVYFSKAAKARIMKQLFHKLCYLIFIVTIVFSTHHMPTVQISLYCCFQGFTYIDLPMPCRNMNNLIRFINSYTKQMFTDHLLYAGSALSAGE